MSVCLRQPAQSLLAYRICGMATRQYRTSSPLAAAVHSCRLVIPVGFRVLSVCVRPCVCRLLKFVRYVYCEQSYGASIAPRHPYDVTRISLLVAPARWSPAFVTLMLGLSLLVRCFPSLCGLWFFRKPGRPSSVLPLNAAFTYS
jgi:hypothetical protein